MTPAHGWLGTALPLAIVALVLALRWRTMRRQRRLRLETLWIVPAIFVALATTILVLTPPPPTGWTLIGAGLLAGAAIGWQRGKAMRIEIDPVTHRLSQQASPVAVLLLVALVVVRQGFRLAVADGAGSAFDPALATDALLGFGLGLIVATRIEMLIRARRLLRELPPAASSR